MRSRGPSEWLLGRVGRKRDREGIHPSDTPRTYPFVSGVGPTVAVMRQRSAARDPFTRLGHWHDGHAYAAVAGLTFFPQDDHQPLLAAWPHLADGAGADWDAHRDYVEPCWCGSGAKYKRCCRPRGLGSFA